MFPIVLGHEPTGHGRQASTRPPSFLSRPKAESLLDNGEGDRVCPCPARVATQVKEITSCATTPSQTHMVANNPPHISASPYLPSTFFPASVAFDRDSFLVPALIPTLSRLTHDTHVPINQSPPSLRTRPFSLNSTRPAVLGLSVDQSEISQVIQNPSASSPNPIDICHLIIQDEECYRCVRGRGRFRISGSRHA